MKSIDLLLTTLTYRAMMFYVHFNKSVDPLMLLKTTKYFLKPNPRDYVDKNSKPPFSLWSASFKLISSIALFSIRRAVDYLQQVFSPTENQFENKHNELLSLAESAGCALLLEGASDIANLGILYLYKKRDDANVAIELNTQKRLQGRERKAKRNEPTLTEGEREIARYHRVLKIENIIHSSVSIVATFVAVRRCLEELQDLPAGSTIFDLSFPESTHLHHSGLLNFLRMPLTATVNMIIFVIGFGYNLRETIHSIRASRPRRGDIPVFGFINAYATLNLTAMLARRLAPVIHTRDKFSHLGVKDLLNLQVDDLPKLGHFGWASGASIEEKKRDLRVLQAKIIQELFIDALIPGKIYRSLVILNSIAYQGVFRNTILVGLNARVLFFQNKPKLKMAETVNSFVIQDQPLQKVSNDLRLLPKVKPVLLERQRFFDTDIFSKEERYRVAPEKIKPKTKGTVSEAFKEELDVPLIEENEENDALSSVYSPKTTKRMQDLRIECLEKIQELRGLKQVPVKTVKGLLNKLENFLPSGDISGVDGSNFRIAWCWGNKRSHMDFETPHGKDPSRFHRRKLEKVLNVLEAGFLWGWQQEKIDAHLEQRSGKRSFSDLAYVFTERPK